MVEGANLVVITETDLTGNRATATEGKRLAAKRRNTVDPLALTAGDLVVHDQHGIGKVRRDDRTVAGGARREYWSRYASAKRGGGSDRLYVPMDRWISCPVTSRQAPTPEPARRQRLGQHEDQGAGAVREIATELVALYAKRLPPGPRVRARIPRGRPRWRRVRFHRRRSTRMTANAEVKSDMEKGPDGPGDLWRRGLRQDRDRGGWGGVVAVQDGKQVAVLVPTTLLADQHLQTFTESGWRASRRGEGTGLPIRRVRAVIDGMAGDGTVDIVIGTHWLLQTRCAGKDPGW